MEVRIFKPAKTAMQQGRAVGERWVLEFEPGARQVEPLMGWTSSKDTRRQVSLRFDSKEAAIAYAEKQGLMYSLEAPRERKVKPKAYADNFRFDRPHAWTH